MPLANIFVIGPQSPSKEFWMGSALKPPLDMKEQTEDTNGCRASFPISWNCLLIKL